MTTYQDALQAEARRMAGDREHATVRFACCGTCGWLRWSSTHTATEGGIQAVVEPMQPWGENCPRCAEVAMRHPELFAWVLSVLAHQSRQEGA